MLFSQTAVRVRAGSKQTRAGDNREDWTPSATDRLTLARVNVQPVSVSELVATDRDIAVGLWMLSTRPWSDADIKATDRILTGGMTCEVVGDPKRYYAAGRVHHVEVTLREWAG